MEKIRTIDKFKLLNFMKEDPTYYYFKTEIKKF